MDRYALDPLATPLRPVGPPAVSAQVGLVVEDVETGFVGAVVNCQKAGGMHIVTLEDRHGTLRAFRLGPGFWIDGQAVELVAPPARSPRPPARTASGSRAPSLQRARVARAGRLWVEGKHDAELVEKIWGDDLRHEGVVVELLEGIDHLPARVKSFGPSPHARLGVLADHLVPGSKESRIAAQVMAACPPDSLLVLGHPWVDVWQAVRPERIGLKAWPVIARGTPWKSGVLRELGWPARTQADVATAWVRILRSVRTYADLDPALLGRVEELIDFVTAPAPSQSCPATGGKAPSAS